MQALLRNECGVELAVPPAQLVTSACWTLRGASAFVAGKLGTTVSHVLQQHSMLHMTKVGALLRCCWQLCCAVNTDGTFISPTKPQKNSFLET